MGTMMLAWLIVLVVGVLWIARMTTRQLPSAPTSEQDRRLTEQAERIEQLEHELRRVKEQADFTERLLSERADSAPEEAPREDPPD